MWQVASVFVLLCSLFPVSCSLASQLCAGGQPSYCARQDFGNNPQASETYAPSALWGAIGAGKVIVGPVFGERILRLTDALTNSLSSVSNYYYDGNAGGSNENTPFSANSDFLLFFDNGGNIYVDSFDPVNLVAQRLYVSTYPSTNGLKISGGYANAAATWNPAIDDELFTYGDSGTSSDIELSKYDFTSLTTAPSATAIKDLTADSNCGIPSSGNTNPGWESDMTTNSAGTRVAVSVSYAGGQGSATVATVYDSTHGTCRNYNTSTGAIAGGWGTAGTASTNVRMTIHNLRLSLDGTYLRIDIGSCTAGPCAATGETLIWNIDTTNVASVGELYSVDDGTGHLAAGQGVMVNQSGIGGWGFTVRPLAGPSMPFNNVSYAAPAYGRVDTHLSWSNDNASDSEPMLLSGDWGSDADVYPWVDEIFATAMQDWTHRTWRFSRDWTTGASPFFNVAHCIGQVSRDGRFFMVASDWGGHLGNVNEFKISSWARTSNVVTVTATAAIGGITTGDSLQIYNAQPGSGATSINGTWAVASVTGSTVTFNQTAANDSTANAGGYVFDNTCATNSDCRGDAFIIELK